MSTQTNGPQTFWGWLDGVTQRLLDIGQKLVDILQKVVDVGAKTLLTILILIAVAVSLVVTGVLINNKTLVVVGLMMASLLVAIFRAAIKLVEDRKKARLKSKFWAIIMTMNAMAVALMLSTGNDMLRIMKPAWLGLLILVPGGFYLDGMAKVLRWVAIGFTIFVLGMVVMKTAEEISPEMKQSISSAIKQTTATVRTWDWSRRIGHTSSDPGSNSPSSDQIQANGRSTQNAHIVTSTATDTIHARRSGFFKAADSEKSMRRNTRRRVVQSHHSPVHQAAPPVARSSPPYRETATVHRQEVKDTVTTEVVTNTVQRPILYDASGKVIRPWRKVYDSGLLTIEPGQYSNYLPVKELQFRLVENDSVVVIVGGSMELFPHTKPVNVTGNNLELTENLERKVVRETVYKDPEHVGRLCLFLKPTTAKKGKWNAFAPSVNSQLNAMGVTWYSFITDADFSMSIGLDLPGYDTYQEILKEKSGVPYEGKFPRGKMEIIIFVFRR